MGIPREFGMKHHVLKPWFLFFPGERRENAAFWDVGIGVGVVKSPLFKTQLAAFDIQNSVEKYIPERVRAGK